MHKCMVELLRKFESCGIKISRVSSIRITKYINLLYFCMVLGSVVIEGDSPSKIHVQRRLWSNVSLCMKIYNIKFFITSGEICITLTYQVTFAVVFCPSYGSSVKVRLWETYTVLYEHPQVIKEVGSWVSSTEWL